MEIQNILNHVKGFIQKFKPSTPHDKLVTKSDAIPEFDNDYGEDDFDEVTYYDTENSRLSRGKNKSVASGIDSFGESNNI